MEYLQYFKEKKRMDIRNGCFKPYYKWNTFNTSLISSFNASRYIIVLNLIINGIPSIQKFTVNYLKNVCIVLNLIINGIPSIQKLEITQ